MSEDLKFVLKAVLCVWWFLLLNVLLLVAGVIFKLPMTPFLKKIWFLLDFWTAITIVLSVLCLIDAIIELHRFIVDGD